MKLLMLDGCFNISGGANLTSGKFYNVEKAIVYNYDNDDNCTEIPYDKATVDQRNSMKKYFTILDDNDEEEFVEDEFYYNYYKIFENDNELAHYLVDNIEGLDKTILNMAMAFNG